MLNGRLRIFVLLALTSLSQCYAIDYRYFVAGGVCAATSHGITTPIDVVKTKMQAQPEVRRCPCQAERAEDD